MTKKLYREDDLLSSFGKYLAKYDFLILALSGNQQGRYWFQMENCRKAPDIIAFRQDIVLVGEAKIKSRELFKTVHGYKSDYKSLQYLLDTDNANEQLSEMIRASVAHLNKKIVIMPPIQAIVVGGDSFTALRDEMIDNRIWHFTVDKNTGLVTGDKLPGLKK